MGALAGLLRARGHEVRGSDKGVYPPMSEQLEALQIPVAAEFSPANLDWNPEVVVVGNTCKKDHLEVTAASERGLELRSMAQVLSSEFLADKHSMVVAGTHGKTTTSSLLAHLLFAAGRDPGFFIGGVPLGLGQGWRLGDGEEFVVEGDEYDTAFFDKGSKFLHYRPRTCVLTSVELDHVDIFSDMEAVRDTFRKLVRLIPEDGLLLVAASSAEALAIAESEARCRVETYGVAKAGSSGMTSEMEAVTPVTWLASDVEVTRAGRCRFVLRRNGEMFHRFESLMVGDHNVANAVAAIAAAHDVGVAHDDLKRALGQFAGVRRRQEIRGIAQGVIVLDDYGHHPTAIVETLKALRQRFAGRRVIAVYEPRTATSRRKTFQKQYADAFSWADALVVGRLYDPSRIPEDERFDPGELALDVHRGGTKATYLESTTDIVVYLAEEVRPGDVVAVFSSGTFDGLHDKLLQALGDPITPATRHEMAQIRSQLRDVGLDADDLDEGHAGDFLSLTNETGFVGTVGLEVYGEDAILRSLAVKKQARGHGYGWMLADTAISQARLRGVRRIYLLTETASDFFAAKLGFRVVVPSTISRAVASSTTFRNTSEGSVAMRLDL
jgi:UDP-N-acetylmuramate: L-alanyl-gamma-D-glutamyl-meso-diaminopimelate ligase